MTSQSAKPIPNFTKYKDKDSSNRINNTPWEVRNKRTLYVCNSNMALLYGTVNQEEYLHSLADAHNFNLLMGITDADYNKSL